MAATLNPTFSVRRPAVIPKKLPIGGLKRCTRLPVG